MNPLLVTALWTAIAAPAAVLIGTTLRHANHPCACGHHRDAHQHYRPGSDCALCDCRRLAAAR